LILQNLKKSNELFIEGINATKRKKYENAISFFNESYTLNNSNIDNLYNIATVYAMQNDIFNACKTWEKLKNMNQIQGKKLFQQNCKQ
jgi:tetratricopeptide (TPR) repeat protein